MTIFFANFGEIHGQHETYLKRLLCPISVAYIKKRRASLVGKIEIRSNIPKHLGNFAILGSSTKSGDYIHNFSVGSNRRNRLIGRNFE